MRILLYSVLIVCLISCKGKEERYNECKDYEDEISRHRLSIMDDRLELLKSFRDAEENNDILKVAQIRLQIERNDQSYDSITKIIWLVRDSCHDITCILKNKQ